MGGNVKTLTQLLKVDGGRNVKTLTCPLGQNQLLKVDGGKCEDPHMPLGAESTSKSRWGETSKSRWGEKCEDPHTPLIVESTTKSRWGEKCEGPHSTTKSRWGGNVKTLTHPLGWNQLLKVDGGKCEDPHIPFGAESTTKSRWGEK